MNALEDNAFTKRLGEMRQLCPNPKAILCISAHWMTEGSWITAMKQPKTIHDFYGFPKPLFEIQYPAPGDPELADRICSLIEEPKLHPDKEIWGLDHGTWSVLRHVFPEAKIPVLQLSLYMAKPPEYHYQLGTQLRQLREEGVLIVGSGNVVHNLKEINWETHSPPYDWAVRYDTWIKEKLLTRDFSALTHDFLKSDDGRLSNPTMDHYYPLLYAIGASEEEDKLEFHFEEIHNASISMRTLSFRAG